MTYKFINLVNKYCLLKRSSINGDLKGTAEHTNKKKAEQMAAQRAMENLLNAPLPATEPQEEAEITESQDN